MSELHQQAINYVYLQVLQKLQCHYSHRQRLALEELIRRIILAAGGHEQLRDYKIMVAHNGGRDTTQAVAFLRAAQLSLPLRYGQSFKLRIVTCHQGPLGDPITRNLERLYAALFVEDDPRVETLLADEHGVTAFPAPDPAVQPQPAPPCLDLLMAGQLTGADTRATFCHIDHQRHARALQRSLNWDGGVNALVRLETPRQRNQYLLWSRQISRRAQALDHHRVPDSLAQSLRELQLGLGETPCMPPRVQSLTLHDLMGEVLAAPSIPLLEFLGFHLGGMSGAVRQADYAHPILLAHIAGLRAEALTLLDYRDGVEHYLTLAEPHLRHSLLPDSLVRTALAGYNGKTLATHRKRANALLQSRYGLGETQLVCMLFAPFVDHGAGLARYLQHCHQSMPLALPYLHNALRGESVPKPVEQWLTQYSGLPLSHLRKLYTMARVHVDDDPVRLANTQHWPVARRGMSGLHPVTGLPAATHADD